MQILCVTDHPLDDDHSAARAPFDAPEVPPGISTLAAGTIRNGQMCFTARPGFRGKEQGSKRTTMIAAEVDELLLGIGPGGATVHFAARYRRED